MSQQNINIDTPRTQASLHIPAIPAMSPQVPVIPPASSPQIPVIPPAASPQIPVIPPAASPQIPVMPPPPTTPQNPAAVQTPASRTSRDISVYFSTPKSNFAISPPKVLSSSSGSSDEDQDNDGNKSISSRISRISGTTRFSHVSEDNRNISVIGEHGSVNSSVLRQRRLQMEGRVEEDDLDNTNSTVLAFVWGSGKLGAAYYNAGTSQLHLLPDVAESAPDYLIIRSLFSQVMPKYVIASQRQDQRMVRVLKYLCGYHTQEDVEEVSGTIREDGRSKDGAQLILLPGKDFAPDACRKRLQSIKLPFEPSTNDNTEHLVFITTIIPFHNEVMTRAAGGLLKFLDVSGIAMMQLDLIDGLAPVLDIVLITMDDMVMVDDTAWNSLQIFNVDIHPSANKFGASNASKEGISLFSWLNKCISTQGSKYLRSMLLRPTRNASILSRRYDVIEFCSNSSHLDFIRAAVDCLKAIKSVPKLLFKLSILNASQKDWKDLYQTIYHCFLLGEICTAQSTTIELFNQISEASRCHLLKEMSQELMRVIDFEESIKQGRLVVKYGIDPELDIKKKQFSCLPEVMSKVAAEEMQLLPENIIQCAVIYMPEVGYLLCVSLAEEDNPAPVPVMDGYEFVFRNQDLIYYKSPRMKELDIVVGDCQVSILDREMFIMSHLAQIILKNSQTLIKVGILVAELDCLMAIAKVSADNNYVRPEIIPGHASLIIEKGRHPLLEHLCNYMPNSTSLNDSNKVLILTGPNASGKSIYMKQVGAIVLMALSGVFVPADLAKIPAYDRICTRIHTVESVSSGMSSFMVDISQMSLALRTATKDSLVLIDEFGKGTAETDGLSLLAASLRDFLRRKENCPTIFLSTHFYALMEHLDPSTPFKLQTMEYMKEGNQIVYLYRLIDGVSQTSFANLVAADLGIPDEIVRRSTEIERIVRTQYVDNVNITPIASSRNPREDLMVNVANEFLNMDLEEMDPVVYLSEIESLLAQDDKENDTNQV